jgi:uncharacterized protein (TIGR02594 family)
VSTRRAILKDLSAFIVFNCALQQAPFIYGALPKNIGSVPDYDGPLPTRSSILGTRPALDSEERIAKNILIQAPKTPTPYSVARYFLAISEGQFGEAWKPYVAGWPVRWNPVIVEFFQATHTVPEGDVTSWCAAFANWCFQRTNSHPATANASSGSFRSFGTATTNPQEGDLVVFYETSSGQSSPHGHVGFFVEDYGDVVEVLGGNQIDGKDHSHRVSSKRLRKAGPVLTLHSFRTDPSLHL